MNFARIAIIGLGLLGGSIGLAVQARLPDTETSGYDADPEVRRRLQSLERTWDLLDQLDLTGLGEPFTRTTLEMVAVAAGEAPARGRRRRRRRWCARARACGTAAALCFAEAKSTVLLRRLCSPTHF